jgi:hypothetical protein
VSFLAGSYGGPSLDPARGQAIVNPNEKAGVSKPRPGELRAGWV